MLLVLVAEVLQTGAYSSMSNDILKEWAQTDAWLDLMLLFDKKIHNERDRAWHVARAGLAQYEVGKTDGLTIGKSILEELRGKQEDETP